MSILKISKTENIPNLFREYQLIHICKNHVKQLLTTKFPTEIYRASAQFAEICVDIIEFCGVFVFILDDERLCIRLKFHFPFSSLLVTYCL